METDILILWAGSWGPIDIPETARNGNNAQGNSFVSFSPISSSMKRSDKKNPCAKGSNDRNKREHTLSTRGGGHDNERRKSIRTRNSGLEVARPGPTSDSECTQKIRFSRISRVHLGNCASEIHDVIHFVRRVGSCFSGFLVCSAVVYASGCRKKSCTYIQSLRSQSLPPSLVYSMCASVSLPTVCIGRDP